MDIVITLIGVVGLVAAIWVIYDVWVKEKMETISKVLWTVFAVFFSIITAIVYYFVKKT